MSTIVTIAVSDQITNSRADINTNFANLNADKIETSVLDTDTTLAANSDAKIPSQKAVKAYVDAGGNVNASETAKGIVEEATDAEVAAGTATGATGAKLFVTPAKLATAATAYKSGSTTKDLSDATAGTTVIAHGLGRAPKLVRIKAAAYTASQGYIAEGTWRSNTYASMYFAATTAATAGEVSTSFIIKLTEIGSTANYQTATVTVDSTNITLTWTKTSVPTGTITFLWEAEG